MLNKESKCLDKEKAYHQLWDWTWSVSYKSKNKQHLYYFFY